MTLADKALELAALEIGVREIGHNAGPRVEEYLAIVHLGPGNPWCAAFVSYCIHQADIALAPPAPPLFRRSGGCARLVELNQALALQRPIDGCVFVHLQPDGHGHTGFVTAVHPDGSFDDISGNSDANGSRTGGQVCRNRRPAGYAQHWIAIR